MCKHRSKSLNPSALAQTYSSPVPFSWYLLEPKALLQLLVHQLGLGCLSVEATEDSSLWFDLYSVRWSCSWGARGISHFFLQLQNKTSEARIHFPVQTDATAWNWVICSNRDSTHFREQYKVITLHLIILIFLFLSCAARLLDAWISWLWKLGKQKLLGHCPAWIAVTNCT